MHAGILQTLITRGIVTESQAQAVIDATDGTDIAVLKELRAKDLATSSEIEEAILVSRGFDVISDIESEPVDRNVVQWLPKDIAQRYTALALRTTGGVTVVAISRATARDAAACNDLRIALSKHTSSLRFAIADERGIHRRQVREYRSESELERLMTLTGREGIDELVHKATLFVQRVIAQAVADRASDIHIEPLEDQARTRFRVDGVAHEFIRFPLSLLPAISSQIKAAAGVDSTLDRRPQDGKLNWTLPSGDNQEIRVATLPTIHTLEVISDDGTTKTKTLEKLTLRILDKSATTRTLQDAAFSPDNERKYRESFAASDGIILVTGPTGSGKSTTLYATLNELNRPEVTIYTVEDPVEFEVSGLIQTSVNEAAGLDFPTVLRSLLRQDPDIILVGEIRDQVTAKIALEAGQSGHLVFATLHTNSASAAPTRLTGMGIPNFLVASSLRAVVAQRLARALCECKTVATYSAQSLQEIQFPVSSTGELPTLYGPAGCSKCMDSGYRGRVGIHEVLIATEAVRQAIADGAETEDVLRAARASGMRTLQEDGYRKVLLGITSIEEIQRIISLES